MHFIYVVVSYVIFGLALPFLIFHRKLRQGIRRRFGLYTRSPWPKPHTEGKKIWFHGASAGDLIALRPTIEHIRYKDPDAVIVISTMTNSGYEIAKTKFNNLVDGITFVPYDFFGSAQRAVKKIQPDVLVLEYAEIWPNLVYAAAKRGTQIVLTNGRFSESLMFRYQWLYRLIGNPLRRMTMLLMRDEEEKSRALRLGAPPERVRVTGNTKFDNLSHGPKPEVVEKIERDLRLGERPVFVAGSTHEGEEEHVLSAFLSMREVEPRLLCMIVPRYVDRASRIMSLVKERDLKTELRSKLSAKRTASTDHLDVVVGDTMGELNALYHLSSFAFVGGSFGSRGGQNILEPAGHGRPVLFGPNMKNFRDSVHVLQGRGGIQVSDANHLGSVGRELLSKASERERLGALAKESVVRVRGASEKNAQLILDLLNLAKTSPRHQ